MKKLLRGVLLRIVGVVIALAFIGGAYLILLRFLPGTIGRAIIPS